MGSENRVYILTITLQLCLYVCYAGDSYVNSGQSIQTAIDSANYGDTIYVAPGTYVENVTLKNGVGLMGTDANTTIIDGSQNGPVVTSSDCDPNTLVCDFTITNGYSGNGSGLYTNFSSPTVNNCIFINNTANYGGGGIYINVACAPKISNCTFQSNSAKDGGAICNNGFREYEGPYPVITNCTFINNTASRGGGINSIDGCNPIVTGCLFSFNTADYEGGGICNDSFCSPSLTNCTFRGNSAATSGGGIYNHRSSNPIVTNCILWGNIALGSGNEIYNSLSVPIIRCSDVTGCGESGFGWDSSLGTDGGGNIDSDPMLSDIPDQVQLLSNSPCIDAGDNGAVSADMTMDLDGRPRIVDGDCDGTATVDMGAYEFDWLYVGDFEGDDCDVDLGDFSVLADSFQQDIPTIDIAPYPDPDGIIDLKELLIIAQHWLEGTSVLSVE